ncbi:MAG: acyl-CoA-binding protein [Candidatus Hydrogenedens sp.]|jgi:acyl-CoA-binding protein|nr:acyl-CoA-binding protein [Candidatus Hydrogenedens sp.]
MSDDLQARFELASREVTELSEAPDSSVQLQLYGLFKQGSTGDCEGERPGMLDFIKRAKFDSWAVHKGMSQDEAKEQYIALVEELKAADK